MQDAPSCAPTDHYIICVCVCVFYLKTQILRHKGIMQNNWKMRPDFNQPIFSYIQCLTYQVVQQDKEKQLLHNLHSYKNLHQSKLPYILEDGEEKKKRKEKKRKEKKKFSPFIITGIHKWESTESSIILFCPTMLYERPLVINTLNPETALKTTAFNMLLTTPGKYFPHKWLTFHCVYAVEYRDQKSSHVGVVGKLTGWTP